MNAIDQARLYLDQRIAEQASTHNVPGLAAVLVRDHGDTIVARAGGVRKWDVDPKAAANRVQPDDPFNSGSISKVVTGFLLAYLDQTGVLEWDRTIGSVFTEFAQPAFAARYGIRSSYLSKTVENLMMHNADLPYAPANGYEIVGQITSTPSHVDEYSTIESEVLRRYNCVVTSLQDAPVVVPGNQILYGGGSVVAAAMAERATGQTYEALLQQHVYDKLGMTRSGIGRLATTAVPDGVWLHRAGTNGNPLPEPWMNSKAQTFTSHNPDGGVYMSAPDMGRFIAANLFGGKPNPVLSELTLGAAQDRSALNETPCARSGWFGDATKLEHNGFNAFMWADLRIYPEQNYGVGVMTNVGGSASSAGAGAVSEMIGILEEMHSGFGLFG